MDHIPTETPNEKSTSFLSGVFLLTLSTTLVKVMGLLTKIPMLRLLGAQGMGYYNAAYEVYAALFVLSTAGLPVALSILVSRAEQGRRRIFRRAMGLFAFVGGVGSLGLWAFADALATRIGNPGAGDSMRALAPAVLFVCLASGVKGYYQGLGDMRPTAISQVLESVGKLAFGLMLAARARRIGAPLSRVAAAGALGLSMATLLALIYLLLCMRSKFDRRGQKNGDCINGASAVEKTVYRVLRPLCAIAVPITLSAGVTPLTRVLDMVLILRRLQDCGQSAEITGELYGIYSTLAIPLYSLLPMLIGSLALPLVPGITRARQMGDTAGEREIVGLSLRLTLLLGLPASMGLSVFARPVLMLLFGGGGTEAVMTAEPLLRVLAISIPGGCLVTVLGAMLQAYGCQRVPLGAMLAGSSVKLISAYILLGMPRIGMLGAPISTFLCHLTVIVIEASVLNKRIPQGITLRTLGGGMLAASVLSIGTVWVLWLGVMRLCTPPRAAILPAVMLCAGLYLCLTLRMGALRREDMLSLPGGERLWRLCVRAGLVRVGESRENYRKKGVNF